MHYFKDFDLYFTPTEVHQRCVPVLLQHLHNGCSAVSAEAAHVLCYYMRNAPSSVLRKQLWEALIINLRLHKSSHVRVAFSHICVCMCNIYSHSFIRNFIFNIILECTKDPAAQVRRQMCSSLVTLRSSLDFPIHARAPPGRMA